MSNNESYTFTTTGSGLGGLTISVVTSKGEFLQVQEGATNFRRLYNALIEGLPEDEIIALARPALYVGTTLRRVSERIGFDGNNVTFDGDIINNNLSRQLVGLLSDNASVNAAQSFVAFIEKIYSNPSKQSQESLYEFIKRYNISILPDGDFIAYKGVNADGTSRTAGYGIVDGVVFEKANLQNNVGSVVEIPRSKVNADTSVGCSTGLHAGSYEYASSFARGLLLTVKINPRDVVSVPDHESYQKIRVSRYIVLDTTEVQLPEVFVDFDEDNDWARDDDYEDYDDYNDDEDYEDEDEDEDDENRSSVRVTVVPNPVAPAFTPITVNGVPKVVTGDVDTSIRETIKNVFDEDSEENFIKFSYPVRGRTNERYNVEHFNIETVAEKANFAGRLYDATFTGRNEEGNYRSFLFSKMENIDVDVAVAPVDEEETEKDIPHILDADIVTPTNRQSPFQVD